MERGLTRQEARGHKVPRTRKRGAEYRRRIKRAKERYPGIWASAAAGRGGFLSFLNYIRDGDGVQLENHISTVERDGRGRFVGIVKLVVPYGRPARRFPLGPLSEAQLETLVRLEEEQGGELTPIPSLDQRRLLA